MRALLTALLCEKRAVAANLAVHRALIDEAAGAGCDLVVFPEFSLTGSINPQEHPGAPITVDDPAVAALAAATAGRGLTAVFGLAEHGDDAFFITQIAARDGRVIGRQRKRHLGDDEVGYCTGSDALVFDVGSHRVGVVICAEAGVDFTWDATRAAGANVVLLCSAPGLYGRRTDDASWRSGFDWWEGCGLGDARRHASRLDVWVALSTQAGTTVDEDFPGIAALVAPDGTIVDRLPDWRAGALVVEIPDVRAG